MHEHILVVEDDPDIRLIVEQTLSRAGFRVTALAGGAKVGAAMAAGDVNLAIVDLLLPDIDGLNLTRQLREKYNVGIIIVSGQGETTDRIIGLEVGADDYLAKPFEPRELIARVRSVLRRIEDRAPKDEKTQKKPLYAFNGWRLDCSAFTLFGPDDSVIPLTTGEFKLLEALVSRSNRVLQRDQLLDLVSTNDAAAFDRSIDVRIGRLRKKLGDDPKNPILLKTVRNGGYIFVAKVEQL